MLTAYLRFRTAYGKILETRPVETSKELEAQIQQIKDDGGTIIEVFEVGVDED